MKLGLMRGVVELVPHEQQWRQAADETIKLLWRFFGEAAEAIEHVGSTAIEGIQAKPIIDIAVGVRRFEDANAVLPRLEKEGLLKRSHNRFSDDLLYVRDEPETGARTHQVHILLWASVQWQNYICFRDYMNAYPIKAAAYERLKMDLAAQHPAATADYTDGKKAFMTKALPEARIWAELKTKLAITDFERLDKGWSSDAKYIIRTIEGGQLLLRVSDMALHDGKKAEFDMLGRMADLGVSTSKPIDFGVCDGGSKVYQLLSWIEGEDAEAVLPMFTESEQYALGLKTGEMLRAIHTISAPSKQEAWDVKFNRKTDGKMKKYRECGIRFDGDEKIMAYLEQNRHLLADRPQCYHHGDYHVGNMVISASGDIFIIDWNRSDYGDPWEEFNRIVWSASTSPCFATGQLNGYFGGPPPMLFFKLLAFYIASNALSSIYWAMPFGEGELQVMLKQSQEVLSWFEGMQNPVPSWYVKDFYIQYMDGVPFKLKGPYDFTFIARFGKVFKVFDDQDSGNPCFGVQAGDGKRYFVKFAGAPTACYAGDPADAVARLKEAVKVYQALTHPALIRLVTAQAIGGGYAAVFEWVDAVCMGQMYPKSRQAFMSLPIDTKLSVFETIMAFHAHVIDKGYVAIDFYDGSIMYDEKKGEAVVCDIDFYAKQPYVNQQGRLWGSSRFMSPEEFELGAVIDQITTVYTMGATAFALFSPSGRSVDHWPLSQRLYEVVRQATSDMRCERQQSVKALMEAWAAARRESAGCLND